MRRYRDTDLPEINLWREARGLRAFTREEMPMLGMIEPGVAAGFLFGTEQVAVAMLDGFVTNPQAPFRRRHRAVVDITEGLAKAARDLGIEKLVAFTVSTGIERVAERLGFHSEPCRFLSRGA